MGCFWSASEPEPSPARRAAGPSEEDAFITDVGGGEPLLLEPKISYEGVDGQFVVVHI